MHGFVAESGGRLPGLGIQLGLRSHKSWFTSSGIEDGIETKTQSPKQLCASAQA
ncbi:hypothetical protein [Nodularia sp. LEGE 04288]|uniref:hypothetical protein n=1 Tax=Nodularia sp. LEGE 04288 TaxID=1828639 RepID=UPI001D112E65|nr:hypothetical protein [Nodularia sp. LEGE 04288]MCC2696044.1 hypothetical protein [Nodularia sp. LEGE 04288]